MRWLVAEFDFRSGLRLTVKIKFCYAGSADDKSRMADVSCTKHNLKKREGTLFAHLLVCHSFLCYARDRSSRRTRKSLLICIVPCFTANKNQAMSLCSTSPTLFIGTLFCYSPVKRLGFLAV